MKKMLSGLVALILASGVAGQARGNVIQLTSPSQLNPSDTTAIYTGSDGDFVASPFALAAGGNTLTFTATNGINFERVDQGVSWTGAFPAGTKLLWNLDSNGNNGGPNTIGFGSSVLEAGLSVQQDNPANTTFTATAFDGATPKLTIMVTVNDSGGPGNLGFIGFRASGGDVITSILISSVDSMNTAFNNDFAMGPVTFGNPSQVVPEPSSLAFAGVATLCLLGYGWRRRSRASTAS
jgi:hypothetical protein